MREILFKGKTEQGNWVEGFCYLKRSRYAGDKTFMFEKHMITTGIEETKGAYGENSVNFEYEVIPETVGQYTGLTDKNGKRIFEGDILKGKHNWHNWNTSFGNDEKDFFEQKIRGAYGKHKSEEYAMFDKDRYFYFRNYVVEYYAPNGGYRVRNGGQIYALTQNYIYNRDIEIIGNIHDNPDLLKGGE